MKIADSKIIKLILAALALPFVLLIRILSPFLIVRICILDLGRIGDVLPHFDMFMYGRKTGPCGLRYFDMCSFKRGGIANYQVKKMVERTIPIYPFGFWVDKVNKRIVGWEKHVVREKSRLGFDLAGQKPPIRFTQKEQEYGQREMRRLGIPPNTPFICFHSRDVSYLRTHQPEINWDYHSYRNADINNYLPAVEKLVNKGYCAIRMGRFVVQEIKTDSPKIIDYAFNGGTDFLDVYLSAHCRFFMAGSDGLAYMPTIFRRPVIWIDYIPLHALSFHPPLRGHLMIPKKLWLIKEKRFLTFNEMLNTKVVGYDRTEDYQKAGIEVIDNPPEEIEDVAIEMEERLNGTWEETEEDKELQERFHRLVGVQKGNDFWGLIGAKFLRNHKKLLELSPSRSAERAILCD